MAMLKSAAVTLLLTTPLLLTGCHHDDDDDDDNNQASRVSYEVKVTNLTSAQPLSPLALVLHGDGYQMWSTGSSASSGLELLAEGGDNTELLAEAADPANVTMSGSGVIVPGASETVTIEADQASDLELSLASMLVNTNDAFTGLRGESVGGLANGESKSLRIIAYDAGTEANTESAATIPGPAAGGEGFNAARDDRDSVGGHPGVVSSDDGLNGSVLGEEHRFDNPVASVTITRVQ